MGLEEDLAELASKINDNEIRSEIEARIKILVAENDELKKATDLLQSYQSIIIDYKDELSNLRIENERLREVSPNAPKQRLDNLIQNYKSWLTVIESDMGQFYYNCCKKVIDSYRRAVVDQISQLSNKSSISDDELKKRELLNSKLHEGYSKNKFRICDREDKYLDGWHDLFGDPHPWNLKNPEQWASEIGLY